MSKQLTIREFFKQYPDDETCLDHIMAVRYGMRHVCQKCGKDSTFHRITERRAYACSQCGDHVYPCAGTLFENSRTSLQLWFYAIYLFSSTRHGVSAKELQRQLGVTYKCAWRMGHEIRKHMSEVDGEDTLSGIIEVDETYVGGKRKGKRGRGADGKTVVFGMLERDGNIMTKIVPDAKRNTLQPHIILNVEKGSEIQSDEWFAYRGINRKGYGHKTVEHGAGQYAHNGVHVNSLEGYWSMLKKGIKSTHIHVSGKHLEKYAKEFEYRYNSRKNPEDMFPELISSFPKS
jgi:transposase-like protein|tara:strand:+ start:83 stop:949 length:867 start_codon:yes stop_codon:yes gene_type:complete